MSQSSSVRFNNQENSEFGKTLNKRIQDHFKKRSISKNANGYMVLKTAIMLLIYFVPYGFIVSGLLTQVYSLYLAFVVMGIGVAGVGFSIMHDAIHGAYSKNPWINQALGYTLNLMGGNATNWKIQHNVLHHTFTNISGHDEDVSPKPILRFSPDNKKLFIHRFQFIYAWFMYGLMTISWVFIKDISQMISYTKSGLLAKQKDVWKAWSWVIGSKIVYFGYALVLPMIFSPFSAMQVFLAFLLMHYVAGFVLGIVFQPAHVLEHNTFVQPSESGNIEQNWAVHQLLTTTNFAPKNRLLSWYVGGLNYQIEHHLFPNICHIHYRHLAPIVKATAEEFNIPYRSIPTFREALYMHGKMLYALGR